MRTLATWAVGMIQGQPTETGEPAAATPEQVVEAPAAEPVVHGPLIDADVTGPVELADPATWLHSPWIVAVLWIVGSFIAAKALDWIVTGVVRQWTSRTKSQLDDRLLAASHGPIVKSVVLMGLYFAALEIRLREDVMVWTSGALRTVAILVWTVFAFKVTRIVLQAMSRNPKRFEAVQDRTLPLFDNVGKVLVVLIGTYALIQAWGWDATGWMASAGIVGIAVGFAAKDTLSNLFAGILILVDAPYRVGDYINLESSERGKVIHIGLRSTRLLTRDDVEVTVPNSVIGNGRIVNESAGPSPKHRIRIPVSVAYGTDVKRLEEILLECVEGVENVCPDPEPRVRFRLMAASGLDFQLLVWVPEPSVRGRTIHDLNARIHDRLRAEGIEIPFPQLDLHVRDTPQSVAPASAPDE